MSYINHNIINSDRNQAYFSPISKRDQINYFTDYCESLAPKELQIFLYLFKRLNTFPTLFISQGRIAKECGTTREHVNRSLKKFKEAALIDSYGDAWQSKTYLLHDILKTKEFKLRLSYIFKVPINDDIVLDSKLDNYWKEVNSQTEIKHAHRNIISTGTITPTKEIKNYINPTTTKLYNQEKVSSLDRDSKGSNSPQQMGHIKFSLQSILNKLTTTNTLPNNVLSKHNLSQSKGCNIIRKSVNLKNFKEQKRTSIMDINISPTLRKATDLFKLSKWGQIELMRFTDVCLENALQRCHGGSSFDTLLKLCWEYNKQNQLKVKADYFRLKEKFPMPKDGKMTLVSSSSKKVQEEPKKKIFTAMELCDHISNYMINKDQGIANMATLIGQKESEAYFMKLVTEMITNDYTLTGEPDEDKAVQIIEGYRKKLAYKPQPVTYPVTQEKKEDRKANLDMLLKDLDKIEFVGETTQALLEIFPNAELTENVNNEEVYEEVL